MNRQQDDLKRRNIRLALLFGGFALLVFATSFPFWQNIFKVLGSAAR